MNRDYQQRALSRALKQAGLANEEVVLDSWDKAKLLQDALEKDGIVLVHKGFDPSDLKYGLYVINWAAGGHSEAAVGSDSAGNLWFAPTNWISGLSFDWSAVESVRKVAT